MSKIVVTTDSRGVTHIRDPRTGKSEVVQLSNSFAKKRFHVAGSSDGVAAHVLYRESPGIAAHVLYRDTPIKAA